MALDKVGFSDLYTEWMAEVPMPPVDMAGYGRDIYCYDDMRETAQEVEGLNAVAQNLYRRLITDRGSLLGCPDYGLDIRSFLNRGLDPTTLLAIPALIDLEIRKELRVDAVSVTTLAHTSSSLSLQIIVEATAETGETGQFNLTVNVTKAGVEIAGLEVD